MSDEEQSNKHLDNDHERTLITLEQLSQTIEVMTSVVNRLRQHLSEQLKHQIETQHQTKFAEERITNEAQPRKMNVSPHKKHENFVVEIRQQEKIPARKPPKILH